MVLGRVERLVQPAGGGGRGVQVRGDRGEHGGRVALVLPGDDGDLPGGGLLGEEGQQLGQGLREPGGEQRELPGDLISVSGVFQAAAAGEGGVVQRPDRLGGLPRQLRRGRSLDRSRLVRGLVVQGSQQLGDGDPLRLTVITLASGAVASGGVGGGVDGLQCPDGDLGAGLGGIRRGRASPGCGGCPRRPPA